MNTVFLTGRLATDPEFKQANGDSQVAVFVLEVERNPDESDCFRIRYWDRLAKGTMDRLVKGREVTVEGTLRQDTYHRDGNRHNGVSIVARRVDYV